MEVLEFGHYSKKDGNRWRVWGRRGSRSDLRVNLKGTKWKKEECCDSPGRITDRRLRAVGGP